MGYIHPLSPKVFQFSNFKFHQIRLVFFMKFFISSICVDLIVWFWYYNDYFDSIYMLSHWFYTNPCKFHDFDFEFLKAWIYLKQEESMKYDLKSYVLWSRFLMISINDIVKDFSHI